MKQIKLNLTIDEANLILEGLGNLPFIQVHELIGKIHQQASAEVIKINQDSDENTEKLEVIANGK
ncbi:MAG: hypothetical protein DRQ62_00295 [Gammaproteobacteria bacterium]|nr:MAG: hypothetical protein DRQ62_00295 [Gammaproteobacteria bacterium]